MIVRPHIGAPLKTVVPFIDIATEFPWKDLISTPGEAGKGTIKLSLR
jgi:hypothetical protein